MTDTTDKTETEPQAAETLVSLAEAEAVAEPTLTSAEDSHGPRLVASNDGLIAQGLGKRFKKRPVLRGVNISVQRGEVVLCRTEAVLSK